MRGTADAAALLDHGVERVVLGTAALETPELVESLAARYPGRVAVGLDHRGAGAELAVRGWEQPSGTTLGAALDRLAGVDLGAVVVTAIDRDGMLGGPDLVGSARRARAARRIPWWPRAGSARRRTSPPWPAWRRRAGRTRRLAGAIVGTALVEGAMTVEEAIAACAPSG